MKKLMILVMMVILCSCSYDPESIKTEYYAPTKFSDNVYFFPSGMFMENISCFIQKQDSSMEVKAIAQTYSEKESQDGYVVVIGKK